MSAEAIMLEQIKAIRELTRLVDLKDEQLAECTRVMREVAEELRSDVIDELELHRHYKEADQLRRMATDLMLARSGE